MPAAVERPIRDGLFVLAGYALLSLLTFLGPLFSGHQQVISAPGADIMGQFYAWRDFGFGAIAKGDFPFWNPHIFGGMPYFGSMQSALLYPPNLLFLLLPTTPAINWSVALHLWLMGTFTYFWLRARELGVSAAAFGGTIAMFSAPFFLHIYAGHLPNLSTMVWVPLVLLALERWFAGASRKWLGLGAVAVAMQIFAGHPQYVYYTGICVGLLTMLHLALPGGDRLRILLGPVFVYLTGAMLGAVQLLPALEAAGESVRSGGTAHQFAASFSLPPANLATFLGPGILGDMIHTPYRGYGYLWEMCLYFGIISLVLLSVAVVRIRDRAMMRDGVLACALLILALGSHTPLFELLYQYLPGYDLFRGSAKFSFFAILFGIAISARGAQWLLDSNRTHHVMALAIAVAAVIALLATHQVGDTTDPTNPIPATLFRAGMLLVVAAALVFLRGRGLRHAGLLLLVIGAAETLLSAWTFRVDFPESRITDSAAVKVLREHQKEGRVLNLAVPNGAMLAGSYELWGYDPGVLKRWAQFCAATQGVNPDTATQYLTFTKLPPSLALSNLRWVIQPAGGKLQTFKVPNALPHAFFVEAVRVVTDPAARLALLNNPGFQPRRVALLDRNPPFLPVGSEDQVRLRRVDSDHMEVWARAGAPAFLVVTEAYSKGWRATEVGSDIDYTVVPADHAFLGIPLPAGEHHVLLSYRPTNFRLALAISIVGLGLLVLMLLPASYGEKKR